MVTQSTKNKNKQAKKSDVSIIAALSKRRDEFLKRRPHRSFKLSRQRDYRRTLEIPGYFSFTAEVARLLWQQKKLFGSLAIVYAVLAALLIGLASQQTYAQIQQVINEYGKSLFSGTWEELGVASVLVVTTASGSLLPQLTEAQQIYSGLLVLLVWMTTVWLLRVILSGNQPKLRDGLYNAGAPIVGTVLISLLVLLQSVPFVAGLIIQSAATGAISGIEAMIFWLVSALLAVLSLYWISTTVLALIIVTLPGMYPMKALRAAGDLVVGRRVRILLRLAWLAGTVVIGWLLILLPVVIVENLLSSKWGWISTIPAVPIVMLSLTSVAFVWASAYTYMLYRKVVDNDAASS